MDNKETEQLNGQQENDAVVINKDLIKISESINTCLYWTAFFEISVSAFVGYLFYYFSTTEGYYGDENSCIDLRKYSYLYGVVTLLFSALQLIALLVAITAKRPQIIINSFYYLRYFQGLIQIILWILLWIMLAKGEECGDLATLVWVFTWLIIISLAFGCCFVACIAVCCTGVAVANENYRN